MKDMTEERKKNVAKIVQELQLYPYRSKAENILRCSVWIASWIIGIAIQQTLNLQSLGSAYLFFALSLLMEFIPESRTHRVAKVVHGIFCLLLIIMVFGALILSFAFVYSPDTAIEEAELNSFCLFLAQAPPYIGWVVCIWMSISVVLALTEMHELIYDSSAKSQQEDEHSQNYKLEQFMNNLNGSTKVSKISVSNITPKG